MARWASEAGTNAATITGAQSAWRRVSVVQRRSGTRTFGRVVGGRVTSTAAAGRRAAPGQPAARPASSTVSADQGGLIVDRLRQLAELAANLDACRAQHI